MTVEEIVKKLDLQPHPEGGFYKEIYRSSGSIPQQALPETFDGDRNYATSIYFLLTSENFSAFHRINQDEIWHFYDGAPITIHVIGQSGKYTCNVLGRSLSQGEVPQFVVPAGCWFASNVQGENAYSLVGCTVAPGFDFNDFELADRENLAGQFPQHEKVIRTYTRQ